MNKRNKRKTTRAEVKAAVERLVRRGLVVRTGENQNGQPVYKAAPLPEGWTPEMLLKALGHDDQ
jgi:predicted transcriptional regulator